MTERHPSTIRVLSAGAPSTGVSRCADAYEKRTGHRVEVEFATAPVIRDRVERAAAGVDVVIAPAELMRSFEQERLVQTGSSTRVGGVSTGVVVRSGAPRPDVSSVASLKSAILAAQSIVYNQASSGQYIAELMDRLGIAGEVAAKTTRVLDAAAVMEHLAGSAIENEIGFGQMTAIRRYADRGVELVGSLPSEIEKVTRYEAGVLGEAGVQESAHAFIEFIATGTAREILRSNGIE